MKKFKKLFAIIIAGAMLLSVVGCSTQEGSSQGEDSSSEVEVSGEESGAEESEDSSEEVSDQYAPDPDETYEITTFYSFNPQPSDEGDLVQRWNEKYNVTFNIRTYDDVATQLNLDIAAGDIPDVMYCNTTAAMLKNYYDQGALASIPDEMIDTYMPIIKEKFTTEAPGSYDYGYFNGERYGIPNSIFYYNEYRYPIVYNGLWLENLEVEAPTTFEEFEELMKMFSENDPDGNGVDDTYGLSASSMAVVYDAFGAMEAGSAMGSTNYGWVEVDGRYEIGYIQPEMKEALAKLNEWYEAGYLAPEFITGENTGGYWAVSHAFLNQQIGVSSIGSGYHWNQEMPGRVSGANYVEAEKIDPAFADSFTYGETLTGVDGEKRAFITSPVRSQYLMFGSQLEEDYGKMARIMEIMDDMMGDPDNFVDAFYGIEGQDYTLEDGIPTPITSTEELSERGAWGTMQFVSLGENNKLPEANLVNWFEEVHLTDSTWMNQLNPLIVIEDSLDYMSDLSTLWETTQVAIITGEQPIEYFDEFVQEWYSMGGQEYEDEVNELQGN